MTTERVSIYKGEVNLNDIADRKVVIKAKFDENKKIFAELYKVDPKNEHSCRSYNGNIIFEVPRRLKKGRTQATKFMVDFYQYVEVSELQPKNNIKTENFELGSLNPEKEILEKETLEKTKGTLLGVAIKKLSQKAIEKASERKVLLYKKRKEFNESKALKPIGLDNRKVLTCDDVGYTKAAGIIKYLIIMENKLNEKNHEADKRLINEFYDCFAFSGASCIIALYLSLGNKSVGRGSIEYLLDWWINKFRYAFSPTPSQNVKSKFSRIFKTKEPEGLSEKNVRKILEGLFINQNTGKQYTLSDINKEVYQPLIFDDLRSRAFTRGETPNITLVDVAMSCAIDPQIFNTKQTEEVGLSIGPFTRSFDLSLAQYNNKISIMSLGVPLRYQPPKNNKPNSAQIAIIKQEANYMTDYHQTMKYMADNHQVKYIRVETLPMDGFSNYSVNNDNLRYAVACGKKATVVSNVQKLLS